MYVCFTTFLYNGSSPEAIVLFFFRKNNPFGKNIHFLASKRQRGDWN